MEIYHHTIPIFDSIAHIEKTDCYCKPDIMKTDDGFWVKHNIISDRKLDYYTIATDKEGKLLTETTHE